MNGTSSGWRLGHALRETFARGPAGERRYTLADLLAGIVVGIVALPLAMALSIACGLPPQHGLYTAIVAGGLAARTSYVERVTALARVLPTLRPFDLLVGLVTLALLLG